MGLRIVAATIARRAPVSSRGAWPDARSAGSRPGSRVGNVMGPIGLHGGGEYLRRRRAIPRRPARGRGGGAARRAAAWPTIAARRPGHALETAATRSASSSCRRRPVAGCPDRAAATGRRRSPGAPRPSSDRPIRIEVGTGRRRGERGRSRREIERIAPADLIYLPGGDPDIVPAILAGSPALAALRAAWDARRA